MPEVFDQGLLCFRNIFKDGRMVTIGRRTRGNCSRLKRNCRAPGKRQCRYARGQQARPGQLERAVVHSKLQGHHGAPQYVAPPSHPEGLVEAISDLLFRAGVRPRQSSAQAFSSKPMNSRLD
jgi:hypothetical protein